MNGKIYNANSLIKKLKLQITTLQIILFVSHEDLSNSPNMSILGSGTQIGSIWEFLSIFQYINFYACFKQIVFKNERI